MTYDANGVDGEDISPTSIDVASASFNGKPWYDVTVYGAAGDGATDDTAALDNAHAAAGAHGTVYYPSGTYIRDYSSTPFDEGQTVILSSGATIKAQGQTVENDNIGLLHYNGGDGPTITGAGTIDGNKTNVNFGSGVDPLDTELIKLDNVTGGRVEGVTGINSPSEFIDIDETSDVTVFDVLGKDCDGYAVHCSNGAEDITVSNSTAVNCGHATTRGGFDQYSGAENCTFIGNTSKQCYRGLFIQGSGAVVQGHTSIEDETNALRMTGSQHEITGVIQRVDVPSGNGVTIDGATDSTLCVQTERGVSGVRILPGSLRNNLNVHCYDASDVGVSISSGADDNIIGGHAYNNA